MKTSKIVVLKAMVAFAAIALFPLASEARGGHKKGGGYYKKVPGSSHKGGTYKNSATHDHYQKRS